MNPGQKMESLQGDLFRVNAQLVIQFALSSASDSQNGGIERGARFAGDSQGVGTAGVGPHIYFIDISSVTGLPLHTDCLLLLQE